MKLKRFLLAALSCIAILTACSKDDVNINESLSKAQENLLAKYPNATDIVWRTKGDFNIANFNLSATKATVTSHSAWFNNKGDWSMTEFEIDYKDLPAAVKTAFEAREYASWKIDDVDYVHRPGMEELYIIEVEGYENGKEVEIDLYYSPDGILVKTVYDSDDDYDYEDLIQVIMSEKILSFIKEHYPSARIIDLDFEKGYFEVEIIDIKVKRELYFDKDSNWVATITEIKENQIPQIVLDAILASEYAEGEIDDVDYVQTVDKNYYIIELELNDKEVEIKVDENGVIF